MMRRTCSRSRSGFLLPLLVGALLLVVTACTNNSGVGLGGEGQVGQGEGGVGEGPDQTAANAGLARPGADGEGEGEAEVIDGDEEAIWIALVAPRLPQ